MRPLLAFLASACLLLSVHAAGESFESQLKTAQSFAKEFSWAKARDVYAEALKSATAGEARERCELGLADASWRADGADNTSTGDNWIKVHMAAYDSLLAP